MPLVIQSLRWYCDGVVTHGACHVGPEGVTAHAAHMKMLFARGAYPGGLSETPAWQAGVH